MLNSTGQNEDYTKTRIEKKLRPITFKLIAVRRVRNDTLKRRFDAFKAHLESSKRTKAQQRAVICFHGCRPATVARICKTGLLPIGHALNPSPSVDVGYFGESRVCRSLWAMLDRFRASRLC